MNEVYKVQQSQWIEELQQRQNVLLEACDLETSSLLRLADISISSCGRPSQPTLTVTCKSREITEAIGLRQAYIKTILKQITGCQVVMALYYKIPEGLVYFDTEGEVTPARWYLCNRKDCGHMKIPLPG
jgi:hypothetical protein